MRNLIDLDTGDEVDSEEVEAYASKLLIDTPSTRRRDNAVARRSYSKSFGSRKTKGKKFSASQMPTIEESDDDSSILSQSSYEEHGEARTLNGSWLSSSAASTDGTYCSSLNEFEDEEQENKETSRKSKGLKGTWIRQGVRWVKQKPKRSKTSRQIAKLHETPKWLLFLQGALRANKNSNKKREKQQ